MKYVGVDGCRIGWLAVSLTDHNVDVAVFTCFDNLWAAHEDAITILVDIPIGLASGNQTPRQADLLARQMLGSRRSTLFLPSVREVLGCDSYAEACETNRRLTGKKISKQYWHIMPKIKAVDVFLQTTPIAMKTVRESHPELCFGLASSSTVRFSKKTSEGLRERLDVLHKYISNVDDIYETSLRKHLRKEVARDDIVDALMLAVTAREAGGALKPLPDPPESDETGLDMAIWYHDFGK